MLFWNFDNFSLNFASIMFKLLMLSAVVLVHVAAMVMAVPDSESVTGALVEQGHESLELVEPAPPKHWGTLHALVAKEFPQYMTSFSIVYDVFFTVIVIEITWLTARCVYS